MRIAIAGTGNIARIHARALATAPPDVEIVAAADVDAAALAAFSAEFRIPAGYPDLDGLLQRASPDLVHLCTPPWLHHEQALACLGAGVSVLVEKPPAISLRQFDEMAAAAGGPGQCDTAAGGPGQCDTAAGGPGQCDTAAGAGAPPWFATVFQHRFGSGHRRLKALIGAGVLGRPLVAVCHTTWFRDQAYFDVPWRGRWDTEGGGPTMGHGIHQMDLLLDALGDWAEVSAVARTQARRTGTEDMSLAHVTFANGAVASVVNSLLSPREESYLRFDFERATVELTHLYGYGDDDWRITPAPGHEQDVLAAAKLGESGTRSGHHAQFLEVTSALRERRQPPAAPASSRGTLSLVAAIYASAFTRRPVTPGDLAPGTPFYDEMNGGMSRW